MSYHKAIESSRVNQKNYPFIQVHLTTLGRKVIALGLKLKELVIIPQLAAQN